LSDHYNETRSRYYKELEYASKSKGDVTKFVTYAAQGFVDGLRAQIERIRTHQIDVAWENFVHEICASGKHKSVTEKRRRNLVLDLSESKGPVPYASLMGITARTGVAYAKKTPRTLTRDLNVLEELGLVAREAGGYRARKERMRAFLPLRKGPLLQGDAPEEEDESVVPTVPL
jgi:DNA-binding HxlR family transcriptional regulator